MDEQLAAHKKRGLVMTLLFLALIAVQLFLVWFYTTPRALQQQPTPKSKYADKWSGCASSATIIPRAYSHKISGTPTEDCMTYNSYGDIIVRRIHLMEMPNGAGTAVLCLCPWDTKEKVLSNFNGN